MVSHALTTCNVCSYAMLTYAERQHTTTMQTYSITLGTVCTDITLCAQGMCSVEL